MATDAASKLDSIVTTIQSHPKSIPNKLIHVNQVNWASTTISRAGIIPIYDDGVHKWIGLGISKFSGNITTIGGQFEAGDYDLLITAIREYNEEVGFNMPNLTEDDVQNCYAIQSSYSIAIFYPVTEISAIEFVPTDELFDLIWVTPQQLQIMATKQEFILHRHPKRNASSSNSNSSGSRSPTPGSRSPTQSLPMPRSRSPTQPLPRSRSPTPTRILPRSRSPISTSYPSTSNPSPYLGVPIPRRGSSPVPICNVPRTGSVASSSPVPICNVPRRSSSPVPICTVPRASSSPVPICTVPRTGAGVGAVPKSSPSSGFNLPHLGVGFGSNPNFQKSYKKNVAKSTTRAFLFSSDLRLMAKSIVWAIGTGIPFLNPVYEIRTARPKRIFPLITPKIHYDIDEFLNDSQTQQNWGNVSLAATKTHIVLMRNNRSVYVLPMQYLDSIIAILNTLNLKIYVGLKDDWIKLQLQESGLRPKFISSIEYSISRLQNSSELLSHFLCLLRSIRAGANSNANEEHVFAELNLLFEYESKVYHIVEEQGGFFNSKRAFFLKGISIINRILAQNLSGISYLKLRTQLLENCPHSIYHTIINVMIMTNLIKQKRHTNNFYI